MSFLKVIGFRCIEASVSPPNKWMQLRVRSVTPLQEEEQTERHFGPQLS